MQIGKPLRTFVVEPLESPIPAAIVAPGPDEVGPVSPAQEPEPEPMQAPVTP
jgi:hypothetical protein